MNGCITGRQARPNHNLSTKTGQLHSGYLGDTRFRFRNPRFKDYQEPPARNNCKDNERFTQSEFTIHRDGKTCRCPAGPALWLKAERARVGQHIFGRIEQARRNNYRKTMNELNRKVQHRESASYEKILQLAR